MTPPTADAPPRNALDRRLDAAALLCVACLSDLQATWSENQADELARRRLELRIRGLVDVVRELATRIVDLRESTIAPGACAHCGWSRPAYRSGLCPRCQELREASEVPDVSELLAAATRPRPEMRARRT